MNMLKFGRPDTNVANPTHEQLVIRVTVLADEISRLSRELATLKQQTHSGVVSVARGGCAGLADKLGINERTVRKMLTSHAAFAKAREASGTVPLTRNASFLAWISANTDKWPS